MFIKIRFSVETFIAENTNHANFIVDIPDMLCQVILAAEFFEAHFTSEILLPCVDKGVPLQVLWHAEGLVTVMTPQSLIFSYGNGFKSVRAVGGLQVGWVHLKTLPH